MAPFERALNSRTTPYDLWTPLRMLGSEAGQRRLEAIHGRALDGGSFQRIAAFLQQAEAFYLSADSMPPESRPLVAYYFVLNLTKALLTCLDSALTELPVQHGSSDGFDRKQRYWFRHERAKISGVRANTTSALRELALRTGQGFIYQPGHLLAIQSLAPYLAETADVVQDATGEPPRLLPLESVETWSDGSTAWLRVEIDRGELKRRGLGPATLTSRAAVFGQVFRHVQSPAPTASFESVTPHPHGRRILDRQRDLAGDFERSLIHLGRGTAASRYYLVISDRPSLLSQEAVTFLVFHHLSTMVRYRPENVTKLRDQAWYYLFTTWVPRAMENYLLAMSSRLLREEVRIV